MVTLLRQAFLVVAVLFILSHFIIFQIIHNIIQNKLLPNSQKPTPNKQQRHFNPTRHIKVLYQLDFSINSEFMMLDKMSKILVCKDESEHDP